MKDAIREAVKTANARFYTVLGSANIDLMDTVWLHSDDTTCLHPGWTLLRGWLKVRASWHGIFQNQGTFRVWPSEVEVLVAGDMAWVICIENIDVGEQGEVLGMLIQTQATNIFRYTAGAWRMVHHHAAQMSQPPLNRPGTIGSFRSKN